MIEQASAMYTDLDQTYRRTRTGDTLNVDDLVRACYPVVYRLAVSILEDPQDAEDATQEALLSAVRSLGSYRGDSSFKTWLYTIAINACRGHLRKRQARRSLMAALQTVFPLNTSPTPEEVAAQSDADRRLWAAVDALDEKHRTAIVLRYGHDLQVSEIAAVLGISEGTVHSRLHYAREKLHQLLIRQGAARQSRKGARR